MGWQDRHYYRDQGSRSNPLMWLLSGSVPLFSAFGVRVRMHASLLLLIVLGLALSGFSGGMGVGNAMTFMVTLFVIILLHEYGHCFAARTVGGEAHDIMMWPLGGLAYADAPNRPWPQFVTAAGGPLVNVLICLICAGILAAMNFRQPNIPLNPLSDEFFLPRNPLAYYVWFTFIVSWGLLLFNLLPIFPLDGGQLLRAILWFKLSYYKSSMIACVVGMIGSALMAMYGVATFNSWFGLMLIFIGASCFLHCYQMRAQLKAAGPWEFQDEGTDYSASQWKPEHSKKHKKLSRRAMKRLRKQTQDEETEQARIDAILAKVSAHGMHSLTWTEKRALHKATERQRQREVELTRGRS